VTSDYGELCRDLREAKREARLKYGVIERSRFVNHNAPVIAGTRIPVSAIKNFAKAGYSTSQIIQEYPDFTEKDRLGGRNVSLVFRRIFRSWFDHMLDDSAHMISMPTEHLTPRKRRSQQQLPLFYAEARDRFIETAAALRSMAYRKE
jgi:uncharacterized protein (DUF433 family)